MRNLLILFIFFIVSCNKDKNSNLRIKSITKTINDTLLEKKIFDKNQNLIFEKHNQIDFGMKNSIIYISAFEYDKKRNRKIEYSANSNIGISIKVDSTNIASTILKNTINNFDISENSFFSINPKIKNNSQFRNTLYSINNENDFIKFFKETFPKNKKSYFVYKYSDTIKTNIKTYVEKDFVIIESIKTHDDVIIEHTKLFSDRNNKKIKKLKKERDSWLEYVYDSNENLILEKENGQHYKYYYKNKLLIKKEMYHDDILAFIEEYYYENGILTKEIKIRKTKSIYFQEIPEKQIVNYKYEYY